MRIAGTICSCWLLSTLVGCVNLGNKSLGAHDCDLAIQKRKAAEVCNAHGLKHVEHGEWREAERCFRRSMAFDQTYPAARNNLALVFMHWGRIEEATSELLHAQVLEPEALALRNNVAKLQRAFNMTPKPRPDDQTGVAGK